MTGPGRLRVLPDAAAWADAAAGAFFAIGAAAIRERGRFAVALSGGGTPRAAYERIAATWREAPDGAHDWARTHLFWGDERWVPADDPRSNYRMAREALIARVPIPPENIHRVRTEARDAREAAADYEEALRRFFGSRAGEPPRFDLAFLGLGADGHTASLFPGTDALDAVDRLAVAVHVATMDSWRVTLTLPMLNRAANVIFLVTGADKAAALRVVAESAEAGAAAEAGRSPTAPLLPAQRIRPEKGALLFLVDRAAAPWAR